MFINGQAISTACMQTEQSTMPKGVVVDEGQIVTGVEHPLMGCLTPCRAFQRGNLNQHFRLKRQAITIKMIQEEKT